MFYSKIKETADLTLGELYSSFILNYSNIAAIADVISIELLMRQFWER